MCAASCVCDKEDESLISLTTHLAQVQFRLRQVIDASDESKETMLKQLEEFVINGCHGNNSMDTELPGNRKSELLEEKYDNNEFSIASSTLEDHDSQQSTEHVSMDTITGDQIESVAIKTESSHPQTTGYYGDYIDYVKQAEESSHEIPAMPVVHVQPIRIEAFGSNRLDVLHDKDNKQSLTAHLITLLSVLQCGCGISSLWYCHDNQVHSTSDHNTSQQLHSLSRAIDRISMLVRMAELDHMSSIKMATIEIELHTAVTMEMADTLLQLLSDGLFIKKDGIINRWFNNSQHSSSWQQKVWSLLQAYYDDKHQAIHPTQSLATSFDLTLSEKNSPKKTLIHVIQLMDKYYERYPDGPLCDELKFRGLICKGFNLQHLVSWIQLLSNHTPLLRSSYSSQSFALQTGFQPIIVQLQRLNQLSRVPEVSLPNEPPILSHQFCIT